MQSIAHSHRVRGVANISAKSQHSVIVSHVSISVQLGNTCARGKMWRRALAGDAPPPPASHWRRQCVRRAGGHLLRRGEAGWQMNNSASVALLAVYIHYQTFSFSVQVRSLTYVVMSKPPRGHKMSGFRNAANDKPTFSGRWHFKKVTNLRVLTFCVSQSFVFWGQASHVTSPNISL